MKQLKPGTRIRLTGTVMESNAEGVLVSFDGSEEVNYADNTELSRAEIISEPVTISKAAAAIIKKAFIEKNKGYLQIGMGLPKSEFDIFIDSITEEE